MHPCQICSQPTHARTCNPCIGLVERLLDQAGLLLPELATEATGQATKTPGGWSTGSEGAPAGIRLAPLQASYDLTQAIAGMAANIGLHTRKPGRLKPQAYKLAWPAENTANLLELYTDLSLAVRTAERLVNPQPELILCGWCPACGQLVKAPADRTYHTCACGQGLDLVALKERRGEMVHDRLDGTYFTGSDTSAALACCGYAVTQEQVSMWGVRGKVPREKINGHWVYLFDDALHQAELKELRRVRREQRKALDKAS
ncbi:hypothetical protein ACN082_09865 [Rothia sp. CCM 9417]|uniref:hypothetical protein n=1 Tax=Rothia sp. CCM 9417 TaxID=3402657 RepID=UPI003AD9197F